MEFHIDIAGSLPDLDVLEQAIRRVDAAVLLDIDHTGKSLRVATVVDATQLAWLMGQAGYPVARHQVIQVPSTCCGGCSG